MTDSDGDGWGQSTYQPGISPGTDCNAIDTGDSGDSGLDDEETGKDGGCFSSTTGGQPLGLWSTLLACLVFLRRRPPGPEVHPDLPWYRDIALRPSTMEERAWHPQVC
jgi:hypothetical protein